MAPIGYLGTWGKLIREKKPEAENLVSDSFNGYILCVGLYWYRGVTVLLPGWVIWK
jgi:hypothetical protein